MSRLAKLAELIERWKEARECGRSLTSRELCPDDEELARELERQIKIESGSEKQYETDDQTARTRREETPDDVLGNDTPILMQTDFESIRLHAKGGLGIVYVATDVQLHREVAVKFMKERGDETAEVRAELVREAEVTGKLEHPGVVPVYGLGHREDGQPFYVMRFIQGESLEAAIGQFHRGRSKASSDGERNLEFRSLLSRFTTVCYTVAYAHNRGIIHRDIKPDNIMLGKYGETLLVDWGLAMPVDRDQQARASGEKTLLLRAPSLSGNSSGVPIGTPAYMSPEQATASEKLTPATDVYSLGATLYKLLTGEAPGKGKDVHEVCRRVRNGEFEPPEKVQSNVPRALAAICVKAMALRPKDRYAGPLEMASDIENWLADEPVSVLPEGRTSQLARWSRRHRGIALALAAGLAASLLIAVVSAIWLGRVAQGERHAREDSLRFAAKFVARTMAGEIDLRWRILEAEASDPKLIELVQTANANPDEANWKPVQDWLNDKYITHQNEAKSSAWFIDDRHGTLIAISGLTDARYKNLIGKNLAYRDYFHGQGKELDPNTTEKIKPLTKPYRSTVFRSKASNKLKVAFCVPIRKNRDATGEVIGVFAMTVDLGTFATLETPLGADQIAVLVDTRSDWIDEDKKERTGLILHHPHWPDDGETIKNYRIDEALLSRLTKLRAKVVAKGASKISQAESMEMSYVDPVPDAAKGVGRWTAAFEPIFVNRDDARDTGWIVIVQAKQ